MVFNKERKMIPFPRMLEYGNQVIPRDEFEYSMQSQYNAVMYLHRNGDLYAYGNNNLGQLGVGDSTNRTTWVKTLSNVKKFWIGVHGTLVVRDDDTIWYTGSKTAFPQLPVAYTSFTDVSSYFSAVGITGAFIKNVHITDSLKILTTDGRFLCCGANTNRQLGNGTAVPVTTLTFNSTFNNNIIEMCGNFTSTVLLLNTNEAYQAGAYQNAGGGTTNRNPFAKVLDSVKHIGASYQCTFYFMQNGTVRSTGSNDVGQCSVNSTANVPETALITYTYDTSTDLKVYSSITNASGTSPVILQGGELWRCGLNSNGQVGVGSIITSINVLTKSVLTNVPNIKFYSADNTRYFVIDNERKLYTCGNTGLTGVANTSTLTYAGTQPWN